MKKIFLLTIIFASSVLGAAEDIKQKVSVSQKEIESLKTVLPVKPLQHLVLDYVGDEYVPMEVLMPNIKDFDHFRFVDFAISAHGKYIAVIKTGWRTGENAKASLVIYTHKDNYGGYQVAQELDIPMSTEEILAAEINASFKIFFSLDAQYLVYSDLKANIIIFRLTENGYERMQNFGTDLLELKKTQASSEYNKIFSKIKEIKGITYLEISKNNDHFIFSVKTPEQPFISFWKLNKEKHMFEFEKIITIPSALAREQIVKISDNGRSIFSQFGSSLQLWNLVDNAYKFDSYYELGSVRLIDFSADDKTIFVTTHGSFSVMPFFNVYEFNYEAQKDNLILKYSLPFPRESHFESVSSNGKYLATGGTIDRYTQRIPKFDLWKIVNSTKRLLQKIDVAHYTKVSHPQFSQSGNIFAFIRDDKISLFKNLREELESEESTQKQPAAVHVATKENAAKQELVTEVD